MEIQPGDFGTSLNTWFRLLGREWKPLLITSLLAYIPLAVVVAILYTMADVGGIFGQLSDPDLVNGLTLAELLDLVAPLFAAGLFGIVIQLIATVFVYLAAARIAGRHYAKAESDWRETGRFAWGRMARATAASLLVLAATVSAMGMVAVVSWAMIANLGTTFVSIFLSTVLVLSTLVILIWLGVSVSLYTQAIAFSGKGPVGALEESFRLIQGRWWATVGFLLVTSLIASVALQVLNLALVPLYVAGALIPAALAATAAMTTLIQGPVVAAIAVAYAIWYIDLRARRETLDARTLVGD